MYFISKQLNKVGIMSADCNDTESYLPVLEEIYSRLDLYDIIQESKSAIYNLYYIYSYKVNYCAWINDRILDNCTDSQNYNSTTRDTLNILCTDRPRGCSQPLDLCSI